MLLTYSSKIFIAQAQNVVFALIAFSHSDVLICVTNSSFTAKVLVFPFHILTYLRDVNVNVTSCSLHIVTCFEIIFLAESNAIWSQLDFHWQIRFNNQLFNDTMWCSRRHYGESCLQYRCTNWPWLQLWLKREIQTHRKKMEVWFDNTNWGLTNIYQVQLCESIFYVLSWAVLPVCQCEVCI